MVMISNSNKIINQWKVTCCVYLWLNRNALQEVVDQFWRRGKGQSECLGWSFHNGETNQPTVSENYPWTVTQDASVEPTEHYCNL